MNRELLEDVIVTALEGGSNYWYFINKENVSKVRSSVPKTVDPYLSTAIITAILDHGVEVQINDLENKTEVLGVLSKERIKERMEELYTNPKYKWAIQAHEEEVGDAESADIVFQYLVMGDVWFG